ncbi:MFS transporter [Streptomyces sp. NPDC048111]|uniref:MFS transporter n=1 Tax=Streptomyces sp. NPDC048111 TaxID=3365500 RepID=UPI003722BF63
MRFGASFHRLFTAAVSTRFADASRTTAFALLVASLSADPRVISAVTAASFLPWLLFGLPVGVLVDRYDKRRAFFIADFSRCLIAVGLTVAVFTGHITVIAVLACAFALTTLQTVSDSCFYSLLPATVSKESLGQANARLNMAQSGLGQFAGAPAGSALYTWHPYIPFLGNVLCFLTAAAAVRGLPKGLPSAAAENEPTGPATAKGPAGPAEQGAATQPSSLLGDLRTGLRWIASTPLIRALACTVGLMNLTAGLYLGILPFYALHTLKMPAATYGLLSGLTAAAMLGGNFAAGKWMARVRPAVLCRWAVLLQIVGFIGLATAPSYQAALPWVLLDGFTAGLWNVPGMTLLMEHAPEAIRGRVMSAYNTLAVSAVPLGTVLAGLLARGAGNRAPIVAGTVCLAFAAAVLIWTLRGAAGPDAHTGSTDSTGSTDGTDGTGSADEAASPVEP